MRNKIHRLVADERTPTMAEWRRLTRYFRCLMRPAETLIQMNEMYTARIGSFPPPRRTLRAGFPHPAVRLPIGRPLHTPRSFPERDFPIDIRSKDAAESHGNDAATTFPWQRLVSISSSGDSWAVTSVLEVGVFKRKQTTNKIGFNQLGQNSRKCAYEVTLVYATFCSCDLDLDLGPTTLIFGRCKPTRIPEMTFLGQGFHKLQNEPDRQTNTPTDKTKCITTTAFRGQ